MKIARRTWLLGGLALASGACETPPTQRVYPELSFSHLPPLRLNVARIEFVQGYVSPRREPFVDHLFPQIPAEVAMRWGRDRLRAIGTLGEATFAVKEASAVLTPLPRTEGLEGIVTQDQSERCDLRIAMSLEVYRPLPVGSGHAEGQVSRSRTLAEDMTLNQREAVWFEMTEQAMRELDRTFAATIRARLGIFVTG